MSNQAALAAESAIPFTVPFANNQDRRAALGAHWSVGTPHPIPGVVIREAEELGVPVPLRMEIPVSHDMTFRFANNLRFIAFSEDQRHVAKVPLPRFTVVIYYDDVEL